MSITRRQFLKRSGLLTAGSFLGPGLLSQTFAQRALADTLGDRFFIVVYLGGGNDGQNTVIPYDNGSGSLRSSYDLARSASSSGGIRITPADLAGTLMGSDAATGATLGLHPGLAGLWRLKNQYNRVAVIQGCGYPDWSLSHEESQNVFESGYPVGSTISTGWVGRFLASQYGSTDVPGVNIRDSIAGEFSQNATSVLALHRLRDFEFPYDGAYDDDKARKRAAFLDLSNAAAGAGGKLSSVGNVGRAALVSTESYAPLHGLYVADRPAWNSQYAALNTSFARRMREIAKVIYGVHTGRPGVLARYFETENGGYDTHSDQGGANPTGQHYQILAEVGDAIELFYEDMRDLGIENKVCILVWSEFGRRIEQNENGTDHGSQGPMFVIGGSVNGGVYGRHPNIDPSALYDDGNTVYSQDSANPFRSTDIRDVYGTILKHWMNLPSGSIVPGVFNLDSGPPSSYWQAANLDLPFLP
jgi:uncharacterized protein (DUF1501 family)